MKKFVNYFAKYFIIIGIVIIAIALIFCLLLFINGNNISYDEKLVYSNFYDSSEYVSDRFQDYTIYNKYYYKSVDDFWFINNKLYKKVTEKDLYYLKEYFQDIGKWLKIENKEEVFDISYSNINEGDYFYIKSKELNNYDNYTIYFYDIDNHILYHIHNNI